MIPRLRDWSVTDVGAVRGNNEDAFLARPDLGLWAVADGLGGHQSGELASGMIVAALDRIPTLSTAGDLLLAVREALAETHSVLRTEAKARGGSAVIASTIVVLILSGIDFVCLWAGDSRAYLLRDGVLTQISRDHSLVEELVERGRITPEEANHHPQGNVITRAIGIAQDEVEMETVTGRAEPGDRFLLCSDGLSKTLSSVEIARLVAARNGRSPAELLVSTALAHQANDNVTAVVIEILE